LFPGDFNITVDERGDTLMYPEGDRSVPASGKMPNGGYFFDCIIRQEPLDEEHLNPEDNTEEFEPIARRISITWSRPQRKPNEPRRNRGVRRNRVR